MIPPRFARQPGGSCGAMRAERGVRGRPLADHPDAQHGCPKRLDSKTLEASGAYKVAFAVHAGAVGARRQRVSLLQTLGLDIDDADIIAVYTDHAVDDALPEWPELPLICRGQVTWQWLHRTTCGGLGNSLLPAGPQPGPLTDQRPGGDRGGRNKQLRAW